MKRKVALFSILCFLMFALAGCDQLNFFGPKKTESLKKAAPVIAVKGKVIARVNNMPITQEDLDQETADYNSKVPAEAADKKITTREQKINFLKNELIRKAFLYQEALDRNLDKREEVIQALEKAKQDLLVFELVREELQNVSVSSKEIDDYYNAYREKGSTLLYQIKEPEECRVRELAVAAEADANAALMQLLSGGDFATLAKERSVLPSKDNGGDLGFISRGSKKDFPKFDVFAFDTLEVGKASGVFKGPDGLFYIIKLEEKRGGKEQSLADMRDKLKIEITLIKQQQKIDELVGRLSTKFTKEIEESQIK